ncbi:MAG TPA: ABC transporter permease [Cyclobacteriaceae bacterium]|nr:ABC transporter permease [Cyclobacteriaceae bacterium]HRJ82320.1 ABC transporter permease [Cyclobacteriaceae bacterium]
MFRNYLTVAIRNILKYKLFSAINIAGLTVGVAACLFIFIYVKDELSFDRFHKDADRIYRVGLLGKMAGQEFNVSNSCYPVGPTMKEEIPGVTDYTRIWPASNTVVFAFEEKSFSEKKVFYVDSNFFSFFSFELVAGDVNTMLTEPNTVVITEDLAKKYFDNQSPLGKLLIIGPDKKSFTVTGVAKRPPLNSHFQFNALISFSTVDNQIWKGWTGNSMFTYVTLDEKTDPSVVDAKLEDVVIKHVGPEIEQLGLTYEQFKEQGGRYSYIVYPMVDTHLHSKLEGDPEPGGDIKYVYIFMAVGLFILIIACINFMNLSTARSAGRAKEVGLRKTLGSMRTQLIGQFLSESFIYSLIAMVLALALAYLLMPAFNVLSGKALSFSALLDPVFGVVAATLVIIIGLLAGSYPALYLTSFNPVEVLKGKIRSGMKTKGVRSLLVVVQFSVSIFLIAATLVVFQQLSFMQERNLGIDKNRVITIQNMRNIGDSRKAFKDRLDQLSGITASSYTNNLFPGINNINVFRIAGSEQDRLLASYFTDWDHQAVMKFNLKDGRYFSREHASDSSACLINESAVRELGWTLETAIGSEILDFTGDKPKKVTVIGVIEDFNYESLKNQVRPLVIQLIDVSRQLMVRYDGSPAEATAKIETLWKEFAPGVPFEYSFLDQDFDALFRAEMRMRDLFTVFSSLAIFIACLGLFALAAFLTEQRTKEIGIRKAMGASVSGLVFTLSKEFMILVAVSFVLAVVPAWYFMGQWLADFAYRIELNIAVFVLAGLLAFVVASLTIGFQALKAAGTNPVTSLRYE